MENPEHEIRAVVRSLCQGTPDEQRRTIETYFTKDAAFVHPFCIVPSFERRIPLLGYVNSRGALLSIFQWYRMLSPTIVIDIDSALHDTARDKLYLDMRQTFSIWFIPFYSAPVRLVTVLDLQDHTLSTSPDSLTPAERTTGTDDDQHKKENEDDHEEKQALLQQSRPHHASPTIWKISKQNDLYQVNDFLKFSGSGLLSAFWFFFQLGATAVCVFMSFFVRLSPWQWQKEPAQGGVEAEIHMLGEKRKGRGKEVARNESSSQSDSGGQPSEETKRASADSKASSLVKSKKGGGKTKKH